MDYYKKSVDEVLVNLGSNVHGLSDVKAEELLKKYGHNTFSSKKKLAILKLFFSQFQNLLIIMLLVAAVIAFFVNSPNDGLIITLIVLANVIIGFLQEFKTEKAMEALKKLVSKTAIVLRDGLHKEIDVENIVPGDILVLSEGAKVAADARVIHSVNLATDEAILTGESKVKHKINKVIAKDAGLLDQDNMVFMGTLITSGNGLAVVVNTGRNAEFGKIAQLTSEQIKDLSPLQKELNTTAKKLAIFALIVSTIVFVMGVFRGQAPYSMLLYAIGIMVAVVPEGLPATVTIALAIGMQKLVKKNALVKQLASVETLGCTMVICTDKTGTLTKNEMTVKEIYSDNVFIEVTGDGYTSKGQIGADSFIYSQIVKIGFLCNNSSVAKDNQFIGDPTEIALHVLAQKSTLDIDLIKKSYKRVFEKPFDSDRKMMSVVCKFSDKLYCFTKGAPGQVLEKCDYIMVKDKKIKLDDKTRDKLLNINRNMAAKALRVLAFAYNEFTKKEADINAGQLESDLIFVGFVGMEDPQRESVIEAVKECKNAGITVMMITGDQQQTALAIAKKIGIINENSKDDIILTGKQLETLKENELITALETVRIFARVNPSQKIEIVSALQKAHKVVAMTGDGVNDAPALKKADIGVAMGSGTDVSKEAANMILLDDSFATIVESVKFGRNVYQNIKKFVLYCYVGIITELIVILPSMFFPIPLALTAIQILWIDLGTEVLPALALSVEPMDDSVMNQLPRSKKEHILDKKIVANVARAGIYQGIILAILFFFVWSAQGITKAQTITFTGLVMFQMFNAFNCRHPTKSIFSRGLKFNWYLLAAVSLSIIMQIIIVYAPFANKMFSTMPLNIYDWFMVVGFSITVIPYIELWKFIERKKKSKL